MKIILQITKIQLAKFFYSPVAWLLFVVLFFQMGYSFVDNIEFFEARQRQGNGWPLLTRGIYTITTGGKVGIIYSLSQNIYLYLPLLTMGLLSAEVSSGSIKLLYSSPINSFHIVLGKYLAMLVFSLLFICCLATFCAYGVVIVKDFDYGLIVSAFLGILLLSSAYAAIGLFISSLSSYQIVVALVTFAVLTVFSFIGGLWQTVPLIGEMTFWLAISDRAEDFIKGLIKSQNIVYFLLIIFLFLTITILRLDFKRKALSVLKQVLVYSAVLTLTVVIGYFSSIPSLRSYADLTATSHNTISESSQKIIEQFTEGPLVMNVYVNILDDNAYSALPSRINLDKRRFEEYQRFKPDMKFNYYYFYDTVDNPNLEGDNAALNLEQLGRKFAKSLGISFEDVLSPTEIRELVDLSEEENQYVRQLRYNGKNTFLRMYDGFHHFPTEDRISAALKRLIQNPPTIAFTTGHQERSFREARDGDYRAAFYLRHENNNSLLNHGFDLMEISLETEEITENQTILAIADPTKEFTDKELKKLIEHIDNGGNVFFALEPNHIKSLDSVFQKFGVVQIPGELVRKNNSEYDRNFVLAQYSDESLLIPNFFLAESLLKYKRNITMPGTSGWNYETSTSGFEIHPFIVANEVTCDSTQINLATVPTVLTLERFKKGRNQRIIIAGDADFISDKELSRRNVRSQNRNNLVPFMFHWLSNEEFPVDISKNQAEDNYLYLANKEGRTANLIRIIYMGVIPSLIFIAGGIILIKRKRK